MKAKFINENNDDNIWIDDMNDKLKELYNKYKAISSDIRHIKAAKDIAKLHKISYKDILKNYTPSNNLKGEKSWDKNGNIITL